MDGRRASRKKWRDRVGGWGMGTALLGKGRHWQGKARHGVRVARRMGKKMADWLWEDDRKFLEIRGKFEKN